MFSVPHTTRDEILIASWLADDPVPKRHFSSVFFLRSLLTITVLGLAPLEIDSEMDVYTLGVYW